MRTFQSVGLVFGVLLGLTACGRSDTVVLQNKGSDTMVNLMQRMSEAYRAKNPNVVVAVTGGGSGTGIKAAIDGTADLANASRKMKDKELELAKANGKEVVETVVAHDGLAIYVHKDNPIARLDFEQLRCIYAADGTCHNWSDLGVTLDCGGSDEIIKLSRQNNSGTYEHFREEVLGETGNFTSTLDQSGTQQVVDVVSTSKCAIGYGGMGYQNASARIVCLAHGKDDTCTEPTIENVKAKKYPFSRPLQVYTQGAPQGAVKEYLDFVLSEEGQKIVLDAGFVPVK